MAVTVRGKRAMRMVVVRSVALAAPRHSTNLRMSERQAHTDGLRLQKKNVRQFRPVLHRLDGVVGF